VFFCFKVIPRKVIGKFSIRIVPDQEPKEIERLVVKWVESRFKLRNSPNKLKYNYLKANYLDLSQNFKSQLQKSSYVSLC